MSGYAIEEIFLEEALNSDLLKEEIKIEEGHVDKEESEREGSSVNPTKTPFKCEVCSKTFPTWARLKKHSAKHNGRQTFKPAHDTKGRFSCEVCAKKFLRPHIFKEHMERHSAEKNHKCSDCGRAFTSKGGLRSHINLKHPTETPFRCEVCSKGFALLSLLKRHSLKHNEDKPYKCDQCPSIFKWKPNLAYHKVIKHANEGALSSKRSEETQFQCDQCSVSYKLETNLDRHKALLHRNEAGLACSVCGKSFLFLSRLKEHMGTHSGDRNHKCVKCGRAFKSRGSLVYHFKTSHPTETLPKHKSEVRKKGRFSCEVCGKKFSYGAKFAEHMESHRKERNHKCSQCGKAFITKGGLRSHVSILHPAETPFRCEVCSKEFATRSLLKLHSGKHSEEKSHKCDQCPSVYKYKRNLAHHQDVHHGNEGIFPDRPRKEGNHECVDCGRVFMRKADLKKHTNRSHPTETPFQCAVCPSSFSTLRLLKEHSVKHNEQKPFKCDQCSMAYKGKRSLDIHKAVVHLEEARFVCSVCGEKFLYPSKLKEHSRTHSGERNYKCIKCGRGFKSKNSLVYHFSASHPTETPFQCELCFKSFSTLLLLEKHSANHSASKPHQCEVCTKRFKVPSQLKYHLVMHSDETTFKEPEKSYNCNKCDSAFITHIDLTAHKRTAHYVDKPFQCAQCARKFESGYYLGKHLITHSEDRPFQCEICLKSFKTDYYVRRHVRIMHKVAKKDFPCDSCSRKFRLKASLDKHVKDEHETEDLKVEPVVIYDPGKNREISKVASEFKENPTETSFQCEVKHDEMNSLNSAEDALKVEGVETLEETELKDEPEKETEKSSLLTRHSVIRNEEKPFKCDQCSGAYKCRKNLDYHKAIVHDDKGRYPCEAYGKKFLFPAKLEEHLKTHRNGRKEFNSVKEVETLEEFEVKVEPTVIYYPEDEVENEPEQVIVKKEPDNLEET